MKVRNIGAHKTELEYTQKNGDCIVIFFSYETPVAAVVRGKNGAIKKMIRTNEKFSRTTSKHIGQWLGSQRTTGGQVFPGRTADVPQAALESLVPDGGRGDPS